MDIYRVEHVKVIEDLEDALNKLWDIHWRLVQVIPRDDESFILILINRAATSQAD